MAAAFLLKGGGKSGLYRTRCWVTPSPGDGKESATENIPPDRTIRSHRINRSGKGEKVR